MHSEALVSLAAVSSWHLHVSLCHFRVVGIGGVLCGSSSRAPHEERKLVIMPCKPVMFADQLRRQRRVALWSRPAPHTPSMVIASSWVAGSRPRLSVRRLELQVCLEFHAAIAIVRECFLVVGHAQGIPRSRRCGWGSMRLTRCLHVVMAWMCSMRLLPRPMASSCGIPRRQRPRRV